MRGFIQCSSKSAVQWRLSSWQIVCPVAEGLPAVHLAYRNFSDLVDRGEGKRYSRHLVDRRRLHVVGGKGGDGACLYTKHTKHKMIGPGWPCGGSGGKGGSVIVKAASSQKSLAHLKGDIQATNGELGRKKLINGSSGQDSIILVPRGVIVHELLPIMAEEDAATEGSTEIQDFVRGQLLADLDCSGDQVTVAEGGHGGRGNTMANPHESVPGRPGQDRWIDLELKSIADVGLVGMPNAGKSTLLSAVSRAAPRIAPYPFTTVAPYIGQADFRDYQGFTIADVPGLVEGAHLGRGLGHEFLRHLERTRVLLYVIDVARSEDPFEDLLCLQREVELYSYDMAQKPCGVVANKCDVDPHVTLTRVDRLFHAIMRNDGSSCANLPLFVRATSTRFGDGVKGLLQEVYRLLHGKHEGWQARLARKHGSELRMEL